MSKRTNKKHLIVTLIFSLVVAFTLFIYEPIVMYAGNIDEFWFDFGTMISAMILPFFLTMLILGAGYTAMFFVTRSKPQIFYALEILSFAGFVYFYIHGNFLAGILPSLYGDIIDWWGESMMVGHILSAVFAVAIVVLVIFGIKKFSFEKTAVYSAYAVAAFSVMMLVSLFATMATPGMFVDKEVQPVATSKNLNKLSSAKNFYILLVDCTDSGDFNEYVSEKYQDNFRDFTYYKDAASGYSSTRDSVPLIFSGQFYKNQIAFNDFSTSAFDNSKTFETLKQQNYNMNFYNDDFVWNSKESVAFDNLNSDISNYSKMGFLKQEIKYILYKYLPFALKSFSKIESMDFVSVINNEDVEGVFKWKNTYYYDNVLAKEPEMTTDKLFQYVHVEGSHSPYDMDEEMNPIADGAGTYKKKIGASAKLANLAIERLKEAGVYDDSVIVIMADHGWYTHVPVLYIKGFNEKYDRMQVSEKQVSWGDLDEAFVALANGAKSDDAFSDVPTDGRTRYFYTDFYYEKRPIIEFVNYGGKSYDGSAWEKTGVEYPML